MTHSTETMTGAERRIYVTDAVVVTGARATSASRSRASGWREASACAPPDGTQPEATAIP